MSNYEYNKDSKRYQNDPLLIGHDENGEPMYALTRTENIIYWSIMVTWTGMVVGLVSAALFLLGVD